MSQTAAQTAAYRRKRRAAGLCLFCAAAAQPGRAMCVPHLTANLQHVQAWRQARKEAGR